MEFLHTGIAAGSEEKADRFYKNILGLEKSGPKVLDKKLANSIFGIDEEILLIRFTDERTDFEILIYPEYKAPDKQLSHSCIRVADLNSLIAKCTEAGLKIIQVPKGKAIVTFISDFDGNLFEVKD